MIKKSLLVFAGLLLGVLIAETLLQIFWRPAFLDKKYQRDDLGWTQSKVTLNNFGYRGGKLDLEKKAGSLRIYSLGDSYTYGWYLDQGSSYPDVLGKLLNQEFPGKLEVINASQPGFSPQEELERFENDGSLFSPDVVTIGINIFDLMDKEFKPTAEKSPILSNSKLFQLTFGNADRRRIDLANEDEIRQVLEENSPQLQKFENQLSKLNGLVRATGGKLVLIVFPEFNPSNPNESYRFVKFHQVMKKIAADQGILLVDLFDAFNKIDDKKSLVLNPIDSHPSAFAHQLAAEELKRKIDFKAMIESGNLSAQNFYERVAGVGDYLENLHSIVEISEQGQKAVSFNLEFGLGIQKTPFLDEKINDVPYIISYLKTAKSYTHDGWVGAKVEINLLPSNQNILSVPREIDGFQVSGVSQLTGFIRKDGSRDLALSELEITKDDKTIYIKILTNQKFDLYRLNLDVGTKQGDFDQGKLVNSSETIILKGDLKKGAAKISLPTQQKVSSLPKFVAEGKSIGYIWMNDIQRSVNLEIGSSAVVVSLNAPTDRDYTIELPVALRPGQELRFKVKYI